MAFHTDNNEDRAFEIHEINVTPFIDVMLVLLIIFMVAAPLSTVDVPVDLPAAAASSPERPPKPIFLTVKADLTLTLGENAIARETLTPSLDAATSGDKNARIFLRADKAVPYGEMMIVLNALRAAGFTKVALVTIEQIGAP